MRGLIFRFDDMKREVDDFLTIAKSFLDPSAEACLQAFSRRLEIIRLKSPLANNPLEVVSKQHEWVIPDHQPLLTRPSQGYEKGRRRGGPSICARITSLWEITPEPKKNNYDSPKQFYLTGNASVRVEWRDHEKNLSMGHWRMEIADEASPGCFFHVQILGEDDRPPFPHAVTVPRLPCIATTPMAVLEFVLGELFQDEWEGHSRLQTREMQNWQSLQKRRLLSLLNWQRELVENSPIAPWTTLKTEQPSQKLFA